MREIGVRELKESLSETLHAVGHGEQVRVTLHGRPLADIVPARRSSERDRLRELVASGRLVPPSRTLPSQPPPLARWRGVATTVVLGERDGER
jgi:prevent-host-death family protein